MGNSVEEAETAESIAREYAAEVCVGTLGEVIDVTREDSVWVAEFRTHTFSEAFVHRLEITETVGNVVVHDRKTAPA